MEALLWTIFLVVGGIVALNLYTRSMRQGYRQVVKTPYTWLLVMSLSEWKTTIKLRNDLGLHQGLKEEQISELPLILMYADLNQLVREGLIEEKYQLKEYGSGSTHVTLRVYRLTPKGLKKAGEQAPGEEYPVDNSRLQPT